MTYKPFNNSESSKGSDKIHGREDTTQEVSYDVTITRDTDAEKNYLHVMARDFGHFGYTAVPTLIEGFIGATAYDSVEVTHALDVDIIDFTSSGSSVLTVAIDYTGCDWNMNSISILLQENGSALLQEDGSVILL